MNSRMIIDRFPKKRIPLSEEYQKIYYQHYLNSREGRSKITSLVKKMESWMHKKVAEDVVSENKTTATLEIGAGTLNHLKYEPLQNKYDIVEPFDELYKHSPLVNRIDNIYKDINDIQGIQYDRIISIATFEHVIDLPRLVAKAGSLLDKKCGKLRVAIPNEGTVLWNIGTKLTGISFRKSYGLNYQTFMQYEHLNSADEIEQVLAFFFVTLKYSIFGINKQWAFYRFYECSNVIEENVLQFL
ncbi:MAG: class I SAM-dependent methyltransferase [Bacteroidota bacterium]